MKAKVLVLALMVTACGSDGSKKSGSNDSDGNVDVKKSESWKYRFQFNGCDTGSHTFNSKQEMCEGLKDDALNNHCASTLREDYFNQNSCPGSF